MPSIQGKEEIARRIRVLNCNIHHGEGMDNRIDLDREDEISTGGVIKTGSSGFRNFRVISGFSPSQGTDLSGPTAVVKSATKVNHRLLGNGMVLDLKLHPSFFENDQNEIIARTEHFAV